MLSHKVIRLILIPLSALTLFAPVATSARGDTGDEGGSGPGYVVVQPSDAVHTKTGTFYPTGPIDSDTVIVIAESDGSLPSGLSDDELSQIVAAMRAGDATAARLAVGPGTQISGAPNPSASSAAARLTKYQWSAPPLGWGSPVYGNNIIGWNDSARITYAFGVTAGTNQQALGHGLGYYRGYNGSDFGVWSKWYAVGTATGSSEGHGSVPWGNVIGRARFKGYSQTLHLALGTFST